MDLEYFIHHRFSSNEYPVRIEIEKDQAVIRLSRSYSSVHISVQYPDGRNNSSGSFASNVAGLWADIQRSIAGAMTDKERAEQRQLAYEETQRLEAIRQREIADADYLLVHLAFNWADEISFAGWAALTQNEWLELKETISNLRYPYEHYVGSNEEVTWETETELLNDYSPVPITQTQYQVLIELFQGKSGEWLDFDDDDEDV